MTAHFTLDEFCRSDIATARGIRNVLPGNLVPAATATLAMLERIRAFLSESAGHEVPMDLSSGYRCPPLNWAARRPRAGPGVDFGGDHPLAAAADFTAPAFGTPLDVCRALAPQVSVLGIGQLIHENGRWIHASTRTPARPINRLLTISDAGTVPGIFKV